MWRVLVLAVLLILTPVSPVAAQEPAPPNLWYNGTVWLYFEECSSYLVFNDVGYYLHDWLDGAWPEDYDRVQWQWGYSSSGHWRIWVIGKGWAIVNLHGAYRTSTGAFNSYRRVCGFPTPR